MESALTHSFIQGIVQKHRDREVETDYVEWGYRFTIFRDVFSPFIAPSGRLGLTFASLPDFSGRRVLDIGCGSGVIACLMALNGASKVVGVDVNHSAIKNAERNASNLKLTDRLEFRHGSLFSPIREEEHFDIVYADLPFTDGNPADVLEAAFYDPHLRSIRTLIETFPRMPGLRKSKLYLAISTNDADDLRSVAISNRLTWNEVIVHKLPWISLMIAEVNHQID